MPKNVSEVPIEVNTSVKYVVKLRLTIAEAVSSTLVVVNTASMSCEGSPRQNENPITRISSAASAYLKPSSGIRIQLPSIRFCTGFGHAARRQPSANRWGWA